MSWLNYGFFSHQMWSNFGLKGIWSGWILPLCILSFYKCLELSISPDLSNPGSDLSQGNLTPCCVWGTFQVIPEVMKEHLCCFRSSWIFHGLNKNYWAAIKTHRGDLWFLFYKEKILILRLFGSLIKILFFPVKGGILSSRISGKRDFVLIKNMFSPGFPCLEKEAQVAPAKHSPLK